jgi:hypothetical protein
VLVCEERGRFRISGFSLFHGGTKFQVKASESDMVRERYDIVSNAIPVTGYRIMSGFHFGSCLQFGLNT